MSDIDKIKEILRPLWEAETKWRTGEVKEPLTTTLERHAEISVATDDLIAAKARQSEQIDSKDGGGGSDKKVVTGEVTYGEEAAPEAVLELTKVVFNTDYDVCADDVRNFDDKEKIYVLESEGAYYHWLKERTEPHDSVRLKPARIPVVFASKDRITLTATFKVISEDGLEDKPLVRVSDTAGDYLFDEERGRVANEFEVRFRSNNKPFEDTIQLLQSFRLRFEYSLDGGGSWVGAGASQNRLYVTWKPTLYDKFRVERTQETTPQVKANFNAYKKCLLESILFFGCDGARTLGDPDEDSDINEESIVEAIFNRFQSLVVTRAREGTSFLSVDLSGVGLGYWRGSSGLPGNMIRGLRYLLAAGEARCGEFASGLADKFRYIAL